MDRALRQAVLGKQPRRLFAQKALQANLVPEFRDVLTIEVTTPGELEVVESWKKP